MFNKVFVIIIIELLVVFNAWAQDKKDENFTYVPNNEVLFLIETDTVKQMVLNRTLMSGIKNYKTIFSDNIEIMTLGPYIQDKGYAVYWLIKDNRLYLADIVPYSFYELIAAYDKGERTYCGYSITEQAYEAAKYIKLYFNDMVRDIKAKYHLSY